MDENSGNDATHYRRTKRGPVLATLAVLVILLGAAYAYGHEGIPASPGSPSASSSAPAAHAAAQPTSTPTAGACQQQGTSASPDNGARAAGDPTPSATGPGPLFNSQMQPYATLTGPYSYVAGGAALRDQGYGAITLTWTGGSTANLVAAYMVWSILNNSVPPDNATLNGHPVTGTWTAYATPSPCWAPTYIYTFIADVTSDVVNGNNTLSGFPSGNTDGGSPWVDNEIDPLDEGASLIAIFTNGSDLHEVTVYTGALPIGNTAPDTQTSQLNYSTTNSSTAESTFIVADGQLPDNPASWNGTVVDSNAFYGSDPKESHQTWAEGNLSDTVTFNNLPVRVGGNNTTAAAGSGGDDCLTWVGQVLSVGVAAKKGPYAVKFVEQGLPSGTSWNVTTDSKTKDGTAGSGPTAIAFSLANGTYSYSVGNPAGYLTAPLSGTYTVAGGPITIRIIFHAFVYPLLFVETGLPSGTDWWVDLTNSSQSLTSNLSVYSPAPIGYNVSNGSYDYITGDIGLYLPDAGSGTVTIAGTSLLVTITFRPPPLYTVTFVEQNLTLPTPWGAYVYSNWEDTENLTSDASYILALPNATYGTDYALPVGVPGFTHATEIYFGVDGGPVTVYVNYTQVYGVRFVETGLPSDTGWEVYVSGPDYSDYGYTTNGTVYFSLPNGTYTFDVDPVYAYVATPASGSIPVAGANYTQDILFTLAATYALTVQETGLATGSNWSVTLELPNDTYEAKYSTGPSITFQVANGSYYWEPKATGFQPNVTEGYLYVEGAPVDGFVLFTQVFAVTFEETGLPTGSFWELYYADAYIYSYGSTIVANEPNGDYQFDAYEEYGFSPDPTAGWVNVTGAAVEQTIAFTDPDEPVYSLTFTETGLTAGTNWTVYVNDVALYSLTASIVFTEPDGTYSFSVPDADGLAPNVTSGYADISGANVLVPLQFGAPAGSFTVTFTESGLPSGATWYINITGESPLSAIVDGSSGTTIETALVNASYTYTATTDEAGWTSPGGTFQVQGVALQIPVPYTAAAPGTFLVTFTETGLPTGSTWYVNITGEPSLSATVSSSGGTTVSISLADGSYSFTAATSNRAWTTASGGPFTVSGAPVDEAVTFTAAPTYTVTFQETGLPNGATWYVNVSGQSLRATVSGSSGTSLTISLLDGGYSVTAASAWKNWSTTSPFTLTVSGAAKTVPVAFAASNSGSSGSGLGGLTLWIGLAVLVIALLALFLLLAARRRKKKEPPTSAGTDTAGAGGAPPPPPGSSP